MSNREDAFDVFDDINSPSQATDLPKISTSEEVSFEPLIPANLEESTDNKNANDAYHDEQNADLTTLAKPKKLIDKIMPVLFAGVIAVGVIIFIIAIFIPEVFSSTVKAEHETSLQDTQAAQANATNQLIDKLKAENTSNKEALATSNKKVEKLSLEINQLKDEAKQRETQLSTLLLANQQSQQIINALKNKVASFESGKTQIALNPPMPSVSSTKLYKGAVVSNIYQGQAWIREGNKVLVLSEGDIFRGSRVVTIDPASRTVQTNQGVIK